MQLFYDYISLVTVYLHLRWLPAVKLTMGFSI